MANTITGKILYIYPIEDVPSKDGSKVITKRSVVIDCTRFDPYTGERSSFENTPMLEFIGERCAELDKFQVGQVATISFDVQGTRYKNRDGKEQIFTRVQPYRIEPRQAQTTTHTSSVQPQYAPQQPQGQGGCQQYITPQPKDVNLPF